MQFGINKHSLIFQRLQIALALRARAIFCSLTKIYLCLFIPNCTRNHLITYTNRGDEQHSQRSLGNNQDEGVGDGIGGDGKEGCAPKIMQLVPGVESQHFQQLMIITRLRRAEENFTS